jgi:hypothetical protein
MSEQEQEPEPEPQPEEEEEEKPEQGEQEIEKNFKTAGVNIEEQEQKEEQAKPEAKTTEADERFKKFWAALGEQANVVSQTNFEKLIVTDEYQFNGAVYKARRLTYKEKHELDALQQKARTLSENENWEEWLENQKNRACLLIEDMTPERFEKEDSYIMTSLISAWGLKPEGFRDLFKSP